MATVAELRSCDGFAVEAPNSLLGWVEETWLDRADHPGALALRTADGRRGLLLAELVTAVGPDTQEVLVPAGTTLLELAAPRIESADGTVAASWRTTGATIAVHNAAPEGAASPALTAARAATARAATARVERPLWQVVAFAFTALVTLVCAEIGADFLIAYLVTGNLPY